MQFIQARNYTPAPVGRQIDLIVVHDMEAPDKPDTAENVAKWFAGPNAPQASAHYCVDDNSMVWCVKDHDVAWAAPGANHQGLHYEMAGYAKFRRVTWLDAYNKAMLALAATEPEHGIIHQLQYHHIPAVKLTGDQVRAGHRGICGHRDVTDAWPNLGDHQDPGDAFPWPWFMNFIHCHMA